MALLVVVVLAVGAGTMNSIASRRGNESRSRVTSSAAAFLSDRFRKAEVGMIW